MSKVIDEVRQKLSNGQNLFRRSTIEKMLAEYDRLLMRNTALEKNAVEQSVHPTLLQSPQEYEAWLRAEFERMGFEFKPQSG